MRFWRNRPPLSVDDRPNDRPREWKSFTFSAGLMMLVSVEITSSDLNGHRICWVNIPLRSFSKSQQGQVFIFLLISFSIVYIDLRRSFKCWTTLAASWSKPRARFSFRAWTGTSGACIFNRINRTCLFSLTNWSIGQRRTLGVLNPTPISMMVNRRSFRLTARWRKSA